MNQIKSLLKITSVLWLTAFSTNSTADVYVCKDDPETNKCNDYALITQAQRDITPLPEKRPTVDFALKNSSHDSIKNGFESIGNTNLYLKRNLWHKGGEAENSSVHLTAKVYKNNEYQKSCHIFADNLPNGKYRTTCKPN
ncbi:hypothetical protein [Pseudomonas sp. NFIX28]|uniref:hypothetical protein n=1 Tax=Pseudomonas sp. NFIX28 TaxID=1566235 RepID=UPI001113749E|nr:hypothetical protein [Pseudomonas sp. NFIX28]